MPSERDPGLRPRPAAADSDQITPVLQRIYEQYRHLDDGEVATYIPELGRADPNDFGICVTTVDGRIFTAGDCNKPFTIQSVSKPFMFGLALEEQGRDRVLTKVGVEPSGDAFNSVELDQKTTRAFNPMVNAGAIATTGLVGGESGTARWRKIIGKLSAAAGRPLSVDEAVYESESRTGHRNRAIAYLMLNCGILEDRLEETLDLYFRQCSILINARDLAVMGATLANIGTNPVTGETVFDVEYVKDVLAVMFSCGMYDFAGEWAYRVGVPAKSGVSGAVLAVVNRQVGIAVYSPRLDERGNSVRGIRVCADLAEELGLHVFDFMNFGSSYLRSLSA